MRRVDTNRCGREFPMPPSTRVKLCPWTQGRPTYASSVKAVEEVFEASHQFQAYIKNTETCVTDTCRKHRLAALVGMSRASFCARVSSMPSSLKTTGFAA